MQIDAVNSLVHRPYRIKFQSLLAQTYFRGCSASTKEIRTFGLTVNFQISSERGAHITINYLRNLESAILRFVNVKSLFPNVILAIRKFHQNSLEHWSCHILYFSSAHYSKHRFPVPAHIAHHGLKSMVKNSNTELIVVNTTNTCI